MSCKIEVIKRFPKKRAVIKMTFPDGTHCFRCAVWRAPPRCWWPKPKWDAKLQEYYPDDMQEFAAELNTRTHAAPGRPQGKLEYE